MSNTISTKTLIPISVVSALIVATFYLASSYAKVEENRVGITKNELRIKKHEDIDNKQFIEIIQRLSRIEEAVKK